MVKRSSGVGSSSWSELVVLFSFFSWLFLWTCVLNTGPIGMGGPLCFVWGIEKGAPSNYIEPPT